MKKIISMVLVLTMLLSLAISAYAIPRPVLSLKTDGFSNGSITVSVNLANNPGIAFYGLRIKYPAQYLTITEVSNTGSVIGGSITTNKDRADSLGYVDVACAETQNYVEDGFVFSATFELKEGYDQSVSRTFEFFLTYPNDFGGYKDGADVLTPVKHIPTVNNTTATLAAVNTGSSSSSVRPSTGGSSGGSSTTTTITWKNASDWAEPELKTAKKYGIIPTVLNGADMQKQITRKEFAALAVKFYEQMSGKKAKAADKNTFTDTTDTEVLKAFNLGITQGMGDGKFEPDFLITREQVATMLHRTILLAKGEIEFDKTKVKEFADNAEISDWAYDAVYFMKENSIINGVGDDRFDAKSDSAREAAIAIAVRGYDNFR